MNQLAMSFDFARAQGDDAAEACASKAERTTDFDRVGCAKFILGWLRRHGAMSGEDCTDAAVEHGFRVHDRRAFGSIYSTLVKRKQIRCIGFCERRYGHGTAGGRIWEATPQTS